MDDQFDVVALELGLEPRSDLAGHLTEIEPIGFELDASLLDP